MDKGIGMVRNHPLQKKIISNNARETGKLAREILKQIGMVRNHPLQKKPIIFLLKGELGGGKTVFVKAIAKALGVKEKVTSPTFILYNTYQIRLKIEDLRFKNGTLLHWDLYRIEDPKELETIGFWEIIKKANIVCIEWPERMGKKITEKIKKEMKVIEIEFEYGKKLEERVIKIDR